METNPFQSLKSSCKCRTPGKLLSQPCMAQVGCQYQLPLTTEVTRIHQHALCPISVADSSLGGCALHAAALPPTSRKRWGHADHGASAPPLPLCLATGFQTAFAPQSECLVAPPVNQYCSCCFKG